jgi:hypothetical protein
MELECPSDEHTFFLNSVGIRKATLDGADRKAGFLSVKTDALRAKLRVDYVSIVTFGNCLVWAFGFASAAVNAVGSDMNRHICLNCAQLLQGVH